MRVAEYGGLCSHEEVCIFCAAMIAWQQCMGHRARKDRLPILYNEQISMYSPMLSLSLSSLSLCISLRSLYLSTSPLLLYSHILPNDLLLSKSIVVVVSIGFSSHNGLHVHLHDLVIGITRCFSNYPQQQCVARMLVGIYIATLKEKIHGIL